MQEGRQLLAYVSGLVRFPLTFPCPVGKYFIFRESKREASVPLSSAALGTEDEQLMLPLWLSSVLANNALTVSTRSQHFSLEHHLASILGFAGHI